jgi:hypothetical protein
MVEDNKSNPQASDGPDITDAIAGFVGDVPFIGKPLVNQWQKHGKPLEQSVMGFWNKHSQGVVNTGVAATAMVAGDGPVGAAEGTYVTNELMGMGMNKALAGLFGLGIAGFGKDHPLLGAFAAMLVGTLFKVFEGMADNLQFGDKARLTAKANTSPSLGEALPNGAPA